MTRKKLRTEFEPGRGYSREDWDEIADVPEATDEEIAQARPFVEAFPDLAESIVRARPDLAETVRRARGRPKLEKPRRQISIRLDPDVIEKFKATGKGWQTRINEVLRAAKL
jgi:uncharacterized protein (DUF4415 family)